MIDQSGLKELLNQHKIWMESYGQKGTRADLTDADLTGADLTGADLIHMQLGPYAVYVQKEKTRIGCEYHDNTDWIKWTIKDVSGMANDAASWWKRYKPIIVYAIKILQKGDK